MAAARPASSDKANIQMGIPIFTDCLDKGAKIGNFRESKDADYKSAGSLRSDCKSRAVERHAKVSKNIKSDKQYSQLILK